LNIERIKKRASAEPPSCEFRKPDAPEADTDTGAADTGAADAGEDGEAAAAVAGDILRLIIMCFVRTII
jgi:hypothetical protein